MPPRPSVSGNCRWPPAREISGRQRPVPTGGGRAPASRARCHARTDYGLQTAPDEEVLSLAGREGRVLISADTDFSAILTRTDVTRPSLILFRSTSARQPERQASLLLANLDGLREHLERGCIATFDAARLRVRALPVERS